MKIVVVKFGGTSVGNIDRINLVLSELKRVMKPGGKIIADVNSNKSQFALDGKNIGNHIYVNRGIWKKIDDTTIQIVELPIGRWTDDYKSYLEQLIYIIYRKGFNYLKQLNLKYQIALKDKWMYFNGKMDDDTIREKGWNLNPFDGLKIMKNDMHIFFNADEELQKMNAQVEYYKEVDAFLKRCMENITWRHQTIKNTIDWRKFMAGS